MQQITLENALLQHLTELTQHIGARPTGSRGNQQAGNYLQSVFTRHGWQVETQPFDCLTWELGTVTLTCQECTIPAQINPYSPSFKGQYPLTIVRTVEELAACGSLENQIVLLAGALSQDPYMPRNFPFFSLDVQQHVLDLLEAAKPEAIIGINVNPLFCDADLHIPNVTIAPEDAESLLGCEGKKVALALVSHTIVSSGWNVIANSNGNNGRKALICAHYDTWFNTPGAVDNATGVTALLGLAERLNPQDCAVQLIAFNGEDHYLAPGQVIYLASAMPDIDYVINLDGIGAKNRRNSVCYYGEDQALFDRVKAKQAAFPDVVEVDPWPMGDHMIFVQRGLPAIALSCENAYELYLSGIAHSPSDTLSGVDVAKICEAVEFVRSLIG